MICRAIWLTCLLLALMAAYDVGYDEASVHWKIISDPVNYRATTRYAP